VQAYESYARYWVESARLAGMRPAQLMERFSLEGYEHIEAAPGRGGAILALPHLGSWEVGGYWFSLLGRPITTVAEPVEPPELFEWVTKQRSLLGLNILPLEKESVGELAHTIRQGGIVALVADRDIVGNGVGVRFFGDMTTLPAGPAVLALRTGAPLLPVAVYQRPRGRYHGVVRPALQATRAGRFRDDVKALTQQLADEFERLIRDAPTQWHMFQPNWPPER
jgi:KDO2-lipid IV(A) lauroyltransferase